MSAPAQPPHKLWTRAELYALETTGLLAGTRYQLIDGEVFDKTGQSPMHASAVHRLSLVLASVVGFERVRCQFPAEPAERDSIHSLPVPDGAVTQESFAAYRDRHPGSDDILLVAEVSDSTFQYDSQKKGRLYARAGFPEYVIVDLTRRELILFRSPREDSYSLIQVLRPGESWHPLHAPEKSIEVASLFA